MKLHGDQSEAPFGEFQRLRRVLTLNNAPAPSLFNAINKGGQSLRTEAAEFPEETSPRSPHQLNLPLSSVILAMALDSVPPYPSDMGCNRATRTQQRIRKDERTWTTDTYAPYDDGHQWRKYGEKKLSNSNFPRFYYRCTYKNDMKCPATKQVQQKDPSDPPLFSVTYFNHHTCSTSSNPIGSTTNAAAQSSSRTVVSISFSPHTSSELPPFLTSSATPQSPSIHSYRANQHPERSPYARQFQWTGTSSPTSNGLVKMEVDNFSEASASSSSTVALPRTLLPISQSRCIEYFHFL